MRGLLFALISFTVACGDNSRQCGAGTADVDGVCTGSGTGTCGEGTILDETTGTCVVDPSTCQDGTVLVGNQCVDPGHVEVDVEEGAEPNGLALLGEDSTAAAGEGAIKAVGEKLVIHGKIVPFQDLLDANNDPNPDGQTDPDVDTYLISTTGPAMVDVSADGLHGLTGAFLSVAAVDQDDPLATWQRFGINFHGDTSRRQLFLPKAGIYALAVTDTRTMFTNVAAGADDGAPAFEYYVSITQQPIAPVALTLTDGLATDAGQLAPGEVKLFSVPMGEGINTASFDVTGEGGAVSESLVITNTRGSALTVKGVVDQDQNTGDGPVFTSLGFKAGDQTLVVADHVINFQSDPVDYTLDVQTGGAGQLPTDGTTIAQPGSATDFSVFFYDVGADGEIRGMDIAFDTPVSGFVLDEGGNIFAQLTFNFIDSLFGDGPFASGDTISGYKGLIRHAKAGRYYFLVFDPTAAATAITATSTHTALTPVTVTKGTVLTAQAVNAFESNPFSYAADRTTDAWQQFNVIGTATGVTTGRYYDPATTAGRLDDLVVTSGFDGSTGVNNCSSQAIGGSTPCSDDALPVFTHTYAQAGTVTGRVLLDDPTDTYLVTVNTATNGGTFDLDFQRRAHTDLGILAAGVTATANAQPLGVGGIQRYLVRTDTGNKVSITAHPNQATLNTVIQRLDVVEANRGAASTNAVAGQNDVLETIQNGEGWTAFKVTPSATVANDTFDLTVAAATNDITYTKTAGTTVFANACQGAGAAAVAMSDLDEGLSTATIATPAGFTFFGITEPQLRVFSNGFISFDTGATCSGPGDCFFFNEQFPTSFGGDSVSPDGIVAPYWDDLVVNANNPIGTAGVCRKTVAGKLVIQWTGRRFRSNEAVRFQVILDPATDAIEYVYAAAAQMALTGQSASIGLEDQAGFTGFDGGFNTAGAIAPATSILLTPN